MPFEIVRNNITKMAVDAVVNTANPKPVIGAGTDFAIHKAAGPKLLEARQAIGSIKTGHAAITPAFDINATYVIHTVGPVWLDGKHDDEKILQNCYENSLTLAVQNGCQSVAFPLIATGNYGFPKDKALQIAISVFSAFLLEHEMQIYLVVYDRKSFKLSEKLFQNVASYIDEHYVDSRNFAYGALDENRRRIRRRREMEICECTETLEEMPTVGGPEELLPCAPMAASKAMSLEDMLGQTDAGFTETLLNLIDKTGKKDSEIYKKANISKQHFSKIRNNPHYQPTKATAIAFALALELDIDQTNDLIGRAGYTLTRSSRFDLIIQYFIEQKNYNIVEINITLYEFDQSLLGS